ncbi:hypothetical protein [Rhizocola hellebori]|nr:hypothetical protein [Rhizocola hellebori]
MTHLHTWIKRVAVVAAFSIAALGGTVVVSAPAEAIPPLCETEWWWYVDGGNNIFAHNFKICEVPPYERPQAVNIQVHDNFNNWTTVASGWGDAAFYCVTVSASNQFRVAGPGIPAQGPFWNRCTV